jgi:hypothetical protein
LGWCSLVTTPAEEARSVGKRWTDAFLHYLLVVVAL